MAAIDVALLLLVVGGFWSLRFYGVRYVGVIAMAAGIATVLVLLRWRGQRLADIGWRRVYRGRQLARRSLEVMGLTGIALLIGSLLGTAVFGPPQTPAAVEQLSSEFWFFLLDVTMLTWVFIAFGEELVFRGMLLTRLQALIGGQGPAGVLVPSLLQGGLFGAAHASQGVTGMLATGIVGTALGVYFLTRGQRSLIPLVISHGLIDTLALSAAWITGIRGQ